MSIQKIIKMGNPILQRKALLVDDWRSPQLQIIIQDMLDTMHAKGGVGIAAPQIGIKLQIIMFGFDKSERYPNEKPVPFTILYNPSYQAISEEMTEGWDSWFSAEISKHSIRRDE